MTFQGKPEGAGHTFQCSVKDQKALYGQQAAKPGSGATLSRRQPQTSPGHLNLTKIK